MHPGQVLARQDRDGRVEAVHTGHAVVLDPDGRTLMSSGDPGQPTYWRSAAKPLQALAVVETGAWEAFGLGSRELAVACGSHAGEPEHLDAVLEILDAAGCKVDDLRCGMHRPWSRHSARLDPPSPLGNNCSGKHAAMLAACRHMGWDLPSYQDARHPLQVGTTALVAEAAGQGGADGEAGAPSWGRDGCGVPTWWLPVEALARAFAWLHASGRGGRVLEAMAAHPVMVSGTGQFCTDLAAATQGRIVGKYGAVGMYGAVDRRTGHALAVKLDAGDEKACKAAAGGLMERSGWLEPGHSAALGGHLRRPVTNRDDGVVGHLVGT